MPNFKNHEECANILADMVFAYIYKDEIVPNDFEYEALEQAIEYLKKNYRGTKHKPKKFEQFLHDLKLYNLPEYHESKEDKPNIKRIK